MPATDPTEMHDLFSAAVNAKDTEALLALYEPTGTAVHLDGTTRTGEQALRAMIEDLLKTIEHIDGKTRKVIVTDDIALTSATWHAKLSTDEEASGTTAEVARRQPDGTWRWVIDDPLF